MANPAYDIYEPMAGGFRGRLASSLASSLTNGGIGPVAVGLDSNGMVVVGEGDTGIIGILVKNVARGSVGAWGTSLHGGTPNANAPIGVRAGDPVDIMTSGTIVNLKAADFPAGSPVYAKADGTLTTDANEADKTGNTPVGFVNHDGIFIVRVAFGTPAVPDLP